MMTDVSAEARASIEAAVRRILGGYPIEPCNIQAAIDEGGEEYISVGLCYQHSELAIDPALSIDVASEIRDILVASGDYRVPYVEHYFADNQKVKGLKRAC